MSRVRSAVDDSVPPDNRDPERLWRSLTSAALADTVFASHARTFREANHGLASSVDFARYVQTAAVQDLGQALPNPTNVAQYAAWLVSVVGPVMAAAQAGTIGGFKPSVQPAIVINADGYPSIAEQE